MRAASARSTDCFSTDKQRTSSWMWLSSCFRIHTLMLAHCCSRSSPAKWYMSSIHLRSGQQLHDTSGCWQSGLCLFVLAALQQVLYVLGWKEGARQPDRESMYWQCRQTIKWPGHRKKTTIPMLPCFGRGNHGLQQGVCVLTCRVWCMECEDWMWKLLDREQQCGAVCKKKKWQLRRQTFLMNCPWLLELREKGFLCSQCHDKRWGRECEREIASCN